MKWQNRKRSSNVIDKRGKSGGGGKLAIGGGLGGVVILVLYLFLGGDPSSILETHNQQNTQENYVATQEEQEMAEMVAVVLNDTEIVWENIFQEKFNQSYRKPKLVLFTRSVKSGCGGASSATGPFYCPADEKIYIDLSFYDQMKNQLGASGDFAMAYVVAHEVGHHVQNLLGTSRQVQSQRNRVSKIDYNKLSVRLELQADFYAGLWANHADEMFGILEDGDIEEALNAAHAIGDDRLQQQHQGHVVPDSFTHGTSAQRMRWFKKGYVTGNIDEGNTFGSQVL